MNQLKLTAFICLLLSSSFFFVSCKKQDQTVRNVTFANTLSFSQVVLPATVTLPPSSATGTITGTYRPADKLFTYSVHWANLTDTITAIHIHGLAEKGHFAIPGPFANGIIQGFTSGFPRLKTGTYNGSLFVDGITIREEDLLGGKFYIDIHSKSPFYSSAGEIRGQIIFDK